MKSLPSGKAPVITPGIVRLLIELSIFAFAVLVLVEMGFHKAGLALGILVVVHYLFSYDRILWLLSKN